MKLISHRGNLHGREVTKENSPTQIDLVIGMGFDVEIDVWYKNGIWSIGHDAPQYTVDLKWLSDRRNKLWLHCKNIGAATELAKSNPPLHYFQHDKEDSATTSMGYIWVYPGKQPVKNSIAVMPEIHNDDISQCSGVCSDFIDSPHYVKMKTDYTIIVQGLIEQESFDFYVKNYYHHNIIFSTWTNCDFKHDYPLPANIKIIKSKPLPDTGQQNFFSQVESTLNGLKETKTRYVIKVRGDEYYSNLDSVNQLVVKDPDRIYTAPIYFRTTKLWPYSPSDHVIAGTTENMMTMFHSSSVFIKTKYKQVKHLGTNEKCAETMLSIPYLMAKLDISDFGHFTRERATDYMKRFFNVFKLDGLKDYKVRYNDVKLVWKNDFIPSKECSIDDLSLL